MALPLTVDIVGPDRVLWSGEADRVSAPSVEGEMGLLAGHEPVLSVLRHGTIRVHGAEGTDTFEVSGGFISFDHDIITAVVDPVHPASED